jgi:hypothetical protein
MEHPNVSKTGITNLHLRQKSYLLIGKNLNKCLSKSFLLYVVLDLTVSQLLLITILEEFYQEVMSLLTATQQATPNRFLLLHIKTLPQQLQFTLFCHLESTPWKTSNTLQDLWDSIPKKCFTLLLWVRVRINLPTTNLTLVTRKDSGLCFRMFILCPDI